VNNAGVAGARRTASDPWQCSRLRCSFMGKCRTSSDYSSAVDRAPDGRASLGRRRSKGCEAGFRLYATIARVDAAILTATSADSSISALRRLKFLHRRTPRVARFSTAAPCSPRRAVPGLPCRRVWQKEQAAYQWRDIERILSRCNPLDAISGPRARNPRDCEE
jgi:hypothetical protein